jgi:hypothetical protein
VSTKPPREEAAELPPGGSTAGRQTGSGAMVPAMMRRDQIVGYLLLF